MWTNEILLTQSSYNIQKCLQTMGIKAKFISIMIVEPLKKIKFFACYFSFLYLCHIN